MAKEIENDDPNGMADPMVVRTVELKKSIEIWAKPHSFSENPGREKPGRGGIENFDGRLSLSGYLSQETGLAKRRIWGIINLETNVTTWRVADKIIAAIERPDLMPEVIPNPRWNQERWHKYMEERGCI